MKIDYSGLTTADIKETLDTQTTFDGRLVPDMAESYKVRELVNELLRRSYDLEQQAKFAHL